MANATSKAWIRLPAGWTLIGGTAVITGTEPANDPGFNLTHGQQVHQTVAETGARVWRYPVLYADHSKTTTCGYSA